MKARAFCIALTNLPLLNLSLFFFFLQNKTSQADQSLKCWLIAENVVFHFIPRSLLFIPEASYPALKNPISSPL